MQREKGGIESHARVCARGTEVFRSSGGVPRPDGGIRRLAGRSQGAYGGLRVLRWRRRGLRHLQRARRGYPEPDNGRVSVNTLQWVNGSPHTRRGYCVRAVAGNHARNDGRSRPCSVGESVGEHQLSAWPSGVLIGVPAFILSLAALFGLSLGAAFALRPLRVARGRGWCDHDYPRWGGHNPSSRARRTGFLIGSELPQPPCAGLRLFALPPVAGA